MATELNHIQNVDSIADPEEIARQELRGFTQTLADIQWLLVILVMFYLKIPGTFCADRLAVIISIIAMVVFVLCAHYIFPRPRNLRWMLAVETWVMIAFITFVLWHTGKIESQLMSLYFLVIITSAIVLDRKTTMLEAALISTCLMLLAFTPEMLQRFSISQITGPLFLVFAFWLVAYFSSMFAGEMHSARQKIQLLSQTDSLTGLWNMRAFGGLLKKEYDRSVRFKHSFVIMMLDADNLKPVNDTYGHESGSAMIVHISEMIRNSLRDSDVTARFGGDEFSALLVETECEQAIVAAERVRKAVQDTPLDLGSRKLSVTVSIGIAGYPGHGSSISELISRADEALYQSKKQGKNRVTVYKGKADTQPA